MQKEHQELINQKKRDETAADKALEKSTFKTHLRRKLVGAVDD